jgi:hypothetical protein
MTPSWLFCVGIILYHVRFCVPLCRAGFSSPHRSRIYMSPVRPVGAQAAAGGVDLSQLTEHAWIGAVLNRTIVSWLDSEYMPQPIHLKLGHEVSTLYQHCRSGGVNDLAEVLFEIGKSLERVDMRDAFVNAWDIANKASDVIMEELLGREYERGLVETISTLDTGSIVPSSYTAVTFCSAPQMATRTLKNVLATFRQPSLGTDFCNDTSRVRCGSRYTALTLPLTGDDVVCAGEVPNEAIYLALTAMLGFRSTGGAGGVPKLVQDQAVAPMRWEQSSSVPEFDRDSDMSIEERLRAGLPEDESSTGTDDKYV